MTQFVGKIFEKKDWHEPARFCSILRVPVYLWFIYEAHFYRLTKLVDHSHKPHMCDDGTAQVDLLLQWYTIELNVFYGYIFSGVTFLMMVQIVSLNTKEFRHY